MRTILFLTICLVMTVNVSAQHKNNPWDEISEYREGKVIMSAFGTKVVCDSIEYRPHAIERFCPDKDMKACKAEEKAWIKECVKYFPEKLLRQSKELIRQNGDGCQTVSVSVWIDSKGKISYLWMMFADELYALLEWEQVNEIFDKIKNREIPFAHYYKISPQFPYAEEESSYALLSFSLGEKL